jgi:hypothetical protein
MLPIEFRDNVEDGIWIVSPFQVEAEPNPVAVLEICTIGLGPFPVPKDPTLEKVFAPMDPGAFPKNRII